MNNTIGGGHQAERERDTLCVCAIRLFSLRRRYRATAEEAKEAKEDRLDEKLKRRVQLPENKVK